MGSFLTEIEKLKRIRVVGLPTNLFEGKSPKLVKTYRHRAATETPYLLRQHPPTCNGLQKLVFVDSTHCIWRTVFDQCYSYFIAMLAGFKSWS